MSQTMEDQELEQDKTYHKSIDSLIEDAEIEAEIEAEKKVRSKNTRLLTISLVGVALIGFIYWQVSETTFTKNITTEALPELEEPKPVEEIAVAEPKPAPVAPAEPEALPAKITKNVEPEVAKADPVEPTPAVEKIIKKEEPVVAKELPKEPAPQPIVKAVVPQPAKIQTPETPAPKKYFVQLGTFSIQDNAKGLVKQLKVKGFNPSIQIRSGRAEKHIVFVGGFSTKESGSQALNDLKSKGFNSAMEKLDDNSYTIVLGKFATASQAETLRDKLSFEGFLSSSRVSKVSHIVYMVQLGAFDGMRQSKMVQKKVGRAGFNDSFIR
jgi:cell division protein FtsN